MAVNYEEINSTVNQLAIEMVAHDPSDINNHHVKEIQGNIAELLYESYLKNIKKDKKGEIYDEYDDYGNEVLYFALIRKNVPQDVFSDALYNLLGRKKNGEWSFNPEKGSFITALKFKIEKKLTDYYNEMRKKSILNPSKFDSLDETLEDSYNDEGNLRHETIEDSSSEIPYEAIINKIVGFGYIIDKYKSLSAGKSEKETKYYKGFFTFDTTKVIKSDEELGKTACKYNDTFFPLMFVGMLEYLMTGSFAQIEDILKNPLRNNINLIKRGELLERFFNVSHPTLSKFSKEYNDIRDSVLSGLS